MIFHKDKEKRAFHYLKVIVVLFLFGLTAGSLSCTSSKGSTSSSGSGTGAGWTVTVSAFPTSASASNADASGIIVQVKDSSGSPAIKGTNVCVTAQRGGFLKATTDSTGTPNIFVTLCEGTTNDIGQVQATYVPLIMVEVEISPGVFKRVAVPIAPGPDIILASAMGVFGSTNIQVLDKARIR